MRTISKTIYCFLLFIVTGVTLFAQLPDFADPLYNFEKHILRPKQAKSLHVLSCTIDQDGKFLKKIVYDGNGHVISDGQSKYIYRYNDNEKIDNIYAYDTEYNQISTTDFLFNAKYQREAILEKIENSESAHKYSFEYINNLPTVVFQQINNVEDQTWTEIKTELGYSESRDIWGIKTTENKFQLPSETIIYAKQTLYHFENNSFSGSEGWIQDSPDNVKYEYFNNLYNDKGQLLKIQRSEDQKTFNDIESFSYYPDGLLKTRSTHDAKYEYKYEFMEAAHLNIELVGEAAYPSLYQYNKYYYSKQYLGGPWKHSYDIYLPDLDIFIFELAQKIEYPIILEPGKTVNIKFKDGKFVQLNNDPANNMIWEIENHRINLETNLSEEKAKETTKQYILDKMIRNIESPIFMYYSYAYDLRFGTFEKEVWDEFPEYFADEYNKSNSLHILKEHAMKMIKQYPYNCLAIEQYCHRW